MAEITGAQLVGDTFQADQGTLGTAVENADGSFAYTATTELAGSGLANSLTITSSDPAPSESIVATLMGVPATE